MKVHFADRLLPLTALSLLGSVLAGQQTPTPNSVDALFQSGRANLSQGKYQEAEEAFRKVSELEPGKARGAMALAQVYLVQKKNDEALQLLQAEASKRPAPPDLHVAIGAVALRVGKHELAIAEFQTVLDTIDKTSKAAGDLYFRMADAYRQKRVTWISPSPRSSKPKSFSPKIWSSLARWDSS